MLTITIKDFGTEEELSKLQEKLGDLSVPLQKSALYMERETRLNFARESDPDGNRWAPLRASTLRYKRTGAILRETGALVGSVRVISVSSKSARIGASKDYGKFHMTGTSKMVARPFIGIGDRHRGKINQVFQQYLDI